MRRGVGSFLILAFCLMAAPFARAEEHAPQTVLIGLDLSKSNPLVEDEAYASRAAARVAQELVGLPLKSRVLLRTFGSYDSGSNAIKIDQRITIHSKPASVARGIAALIADVPKLVGAGKLKAQAKTNIIPFLETMSQTLDCKAGSTRIILLTDGFEDSEYAKLTRKGGRLPKPAATFAGCAELQMLGLGQGANSPNATNRLRKEWDSWSARAGFARFTGLYDW